MTTYHPHVSDTRYVNNSRPNWRRAYHEGYAAHYDQLRKDRHGARISDDIVIRGRTERLDGTLYRIVDCSDAQLRAIAWRLAERDVNAAMIQYEENRAKAAA